MMLRNHSDTEKHVPNDATVRSMVTSAYSRLKRLRSREVMYELSCMFSTANIQLLSAFKVYQCMMNEDDCILLDSAPHFHPMSTIGGQPIVFSNPRYLDARGHVTKYSNPSFFGWVAISTLTQAVGCFAKH